MKARRYRSQQSDPEFIKRLIKAEKASPLGRPPPSHFDIMMERSKRMGPPRLGPNKDKPGRWDFWVGIGIFIVLAIIIGWGIPEIIKWGMQ